MKDPRKSYNSRGTGCTLSRQNLESLTGLWQAAMAGNPAAWRDMEAVLDSKSSTSIVMKAHDISMLGMLRNFVQAKRLITNELSLRLKELADVEAAIWKMLDDPTVGEDEKRELRRLVAEANPPKIQGRAATMAVVDDLSNQVPEPTPPEAA